MKKRLALILGMSLATVFAQPPEGEGRGRGPEGGRMGRPGMRPSPLRNALDANHDGVISAEELRNAPAALKALDKNNDGSITPDEVRPQGGPEGPEGGRRGPEGRENAGASDDEMVNMLMRFDKNGDGKLTKDEVPERMQGLFERGDANKDGILTKEEIRKVAQVQSQAREKEQNAPGGGEPGRALRESFNQMGFIMRDPLYMALDTDHDGKISASEISAAPKSLLALDKNGDGQLTADELMPAGPPPGGGDRFGGGDPTEMANRVFEQFDANKDGKLSRAEAPERMQELFDRADTKKTGTITKDQLIQALEAQRRSRMERQ